MPYYIFKPATNTPETGSAYPQVQKMSPGYNYKAPNSVHALSREVKKLPDYEPNLDYFIANSRSKLSDLLSVAVIHGGFLISEKLKTVIEQFNLPPHKFYPAPVQHQKKFFKYYWLHVTCDLTESVDYERSTFFVYHNFSKNIGYVEISSRDQLLQKENNLKELNPDKTLAIWAEKIALNPSFDKKLDLFKVTKFDANSYISERLYQSLLKEKITGCSITAANHIITIFLSTCCSFPFTII